MYLFILELCILDLFIIYRCFYYRNNTHELGMAVALAAQPSGAERPSLLRNPKALAPLLAQPKDGWAACRKRCASVLGCATWIYRYNQ